MNNLRKDLKSIGFIKAFSSVQITVACLFLLFVLTFWGTVAQVSQGLYQAQERFFHSYVFTVLGFIPFPGAQLVLWVLFINLVCVAITRFVFKLSHMGILVIHTGLLLYFISAFVTFHVTRESNLTLLEGETSNVASAYHQWEISVWPSQEASPRKVTAYEIKNFRPGAQLPFNDLGFSATVINYFPNADAFTRANKGLPIEPVNASGITGLTASPIHKEPEKNMPGVILQIRDTNKEEAQLLLYAKESKPTQLNLNGQEYSMQLRRKRYELPFVLTLKEFQMENHPGTNIARSYKSFVDITSHSLTREVMIHMNTPLRYKDYTLYQASFGVDQMGRELSTLAVVKNSGRLLPYISSLVTFSGLALHFLLMAFRSKKERRAKVA